MRTLEEQLNEYGNYRADNRLHLTSEDLQLSPRVTPLMRRRGARGWQVGLAVFLATLVVGGLGYLFSREPSDVAGTSSLPSSTATTATTPDSETDLPRRSTDSIVGQTAPELSGKLIGGGTFDLTALRGQKVIVVFWYLAGDNRPTNLLVRLQAFADNNEHIAVVGVNGFDDPVVASLWMAENNITIPVFDVTARNNKVVGEWRTKGIPTTYLINEDGRVVGARFGQLTTSDLYEMLNDIAWCDTPCASIADAPAPRYLPRGLEDSGENPGNVTIHVGPPSEWDLWEQTDDGQILLDDTTQVTEMYVQDERLISDWFGLHLIADAKPGEADATTEMIWSSGLGEGTVHELNQVLERGTTEDLFFHLHCTSSQTAWPVVALVDTNFTPVQAWAVVNLLEFFPIAVEGVTCQ